MSFGDWIRNIGSWFKSIQYIAYGKVYGPAPMPSREREINEDMLAQDREHDDQRDDVDHVTQDPDHP